MLFRSDAVTLNNLYPTPTDVQLRLGYTQYSLLTTTDGVETIDSITNVGTLATLTTASAHGLSTGAKVSITGADPTEYNGIYTITVTSSTTFTYSMTATPTGSATTMGVYAIGISDEVNTLMNYSGANTEVLFAVAGDTIYDTSTNPATVALTGLLSDKFQYVNIANQGGHYLVAVNGIDPALIYNGTEWLKIAGTNTVYGITSITHVGAVATLTTASPHNLITGNQITVTGAVPAAYNGTYKITVTGASTFTYTMASTPATDATTVGSYSVALYITGVDSQDLIHVNLFKNRLYFTQKNSLSFWYLPTDSIGGLAVEFDLGGIARMGGFLQAMGTWTIDAGQGADDYAVFVTNMGECIVYNGTNPDSADTWALKGVWQLGYIFARRCFYKFAGDVLLLTQDGLVPLASALQSSRLDPRVNLTDKIYYAISQAATLYGINFGWQMAYYASQNMLIINVPFNTGPQQFVMNTISKAWASFSGINAQCWELSNDQMYFGGTGYIGHFWNAYSDDGNNINAEAQQAYSYFDSPGQLKRFTLVRPILQSSGGVPTVLCGISVDFEPIDNLGAVSFNPAAQREAIWEIGRAHV